MKVTLHIPDELYEKYEARGGAQANSTTEDLLLAQLERFREVSPMDRVVVVLSKERAALEKILSGGMIRDGADLLQKVQSLASCEIGGVKIDFSPGEWKNIKTYATKNRIPVEAAVSQVVHGMKDQFGLYVG